MLIEFALESIRTFCLSLAGMFILTTIAGTAFLVALLIKHFLEKYINF